MFGFLKFWQWPLRAQVGVGALAAIAIYAFSDPITSAWSDFDAFAAGLPGWVWWLGAVFASTLLLVTVFQVSYQLASAPGANKVSSDPRFKKLPWWAKWIALFPTTTRYGLAALPFLFFSTLGIVGAVTFHWAFQMWILVGVAASTAYIWAGLKLVPVEVSTEGGEDQPNLGLFVVLDERIPLVFTPGLVLTIPYVSRLILFRWDRINRNLTYEGVRCRLNPLVKDADGFLHSIAEAVRADDSETANSGGEVDFTVAITVEPNHGNPWALIDLDQAGGREGAFSILVDAVGEDVRQLGRLVTWLQASFGNDILSAKIIADMTGTYEFEGSSILENPSNERVLRYLNTAQLNGLSDVRGLGFLIRRLNIIKVEPQGELKKAAERSAVEELQALGFLRTADGIANAVARLRQRQLGSDGSLTKKDLVDIVMVNDPDSRVKRDITELRLPDAHVIGEFIVRALSNVSTK